MVDSDNFMSRFKSGSRTQLVVFYVKLRDIWSDDFKFETALRLLPFRQQTKIISKRFAKDAHTALANQLLQRYVCSELTGTPAESLRFTANEYGKPRLVGSDFSFSMSNQRGYTAMVVSSDGADVGIDLASMEDVEQFGDEDYARHFKDVFHPNEYHFITEIEDKQVVKNVFTHFWALKESYTKKLGVGLNGDLSAYWFSGVNELKTPKHSDEGPKALTIMEREWDGNTRLRVYDNEETVAIYSTMIDNQVVVSVCRDGLSDESPTLVEVPLEVIVNGISRDQ